MRADRGRCGADAHAGPAGGVADSATACAGSRAGHGARWAGRQRGPGATRWNQAGSNGAGSRVRFREAARREFFSAEAPGGIVVAVAPAACGHFAKVISGAYSGWFAWG